MVRTRARRGPDTLSAADKIYGISLIWQEANYNFAFFESGPDSTWDAAYREAVSRALACPTRYAFLREAQRFVALLGEAHTNLEFGKDDRARYAAAPALELEEIERRAIVTDVARDLAARIPIGSEIVQVDGRPTSGVLSASVFPFMSHSTEAYLWRESIRGNVWRAVGLLFGRPGTRVRLDLRTPHGESRTVTLERFPPGSAIDWIRPSRRQAPVLEFRWLDDGIAYVAANTFNDTSIVRLFEDRLPELRRADALILDIRNNGGGNSRNGWNIGRYFSSTPLAVSRWKTRFHLAAYKAWGARSNDPEKQAHAAMNAWDGPSEASTVDPPPGGSLNVPLAILIGSSTYSAAEDFLSFMRAVPNCIYVGSRSAGSTGQPLGFQIPGGGWVGITSKHDAMPDGTEFVRCGFAPDVEIEETVEAYRAGRDLVLERAVDVPRARVERGAGEY